MQLTKTLVTPQEKYMTRVAIVDFVICLQDLLCLELQM